MQATDARQVAERVITECVEAQRALLEPDSLDAILEAARLIGDSLGAGGTVLLFGNGGSAADATHLAAEFLGRFQRERSAVPAVALADNQSTVTAIANDYGFEHIFSRQIEGLGRPGDVAIAISTSGEAANVLAGVRVARERGIVTIGLTGSRGDALREAVDLCLVVASATTARIQEAHILIGHLLCELVEQNLS